ncbi:triose-phosphate isomerase [Candidatus Shapirobacteria bacterium CG08_land_8_20_14_0_20_39_18]|uniref:Triose-phosphate isomerase n=1 Tax=Candidatus Shapirobacteria bacterium CG08_land_8_20_14_0_20_39_18 TaxID=1974883 RepID=A0A2M6XE28_9BACT|nr:MAG: triose-phosphate isomerase [Candidatus Shapirobacteria bacterium CG08_land_8_20_14_0_20_39_18]PIY64763.1 MAG: triose-phosphate isomerase [Candidatus Shapirobacteria bacterium CG_4_10_14_0_8_um_filter_39_15]PJE67890.1 MAG: triose-phosphate isomerase [Candidatus Shapirobacteria bacterium CG10_big_fil_rev_8_21_14_0_10_38_8]
MIFVNFKTYPQGTGQKAVELVKICESVSKESGVEIIPVVQAVDLWRVTQAVKIPVWVQHVDWFEPGQHTGWINLESVIESGASGTLLNHSEHQLAPGTINQVIKRSEKRDAGSGKKFQIMVCCKTTGQAERLLKLKPDFLAYEPPELIGNKMKSVTTEKPKVIKKIVELSSISVIVGAGIHSKQDIETSLKMGAKGILVSSDIVLADNPEQELRKLTGGSS